MAGRTDFHMQIALLGRTRLEGLAAGAGNSDFSVFRVNSRFHLLSFSRCSIALYSRPQGLKFKRTMIGGACKGRQAGNREGSRAIWDSGNCFRKVLALTGPVGPDCGLFARFKHPLHQLL